MGDTMLVAVHKRADVPNDDFYLPVHVGHALNPVDLGYTADDTGENISGRNRSYCELTALYWAWKNLDLSETDLIGLSHYRRYFRGSRPGPNSSGILSRAEAVALLGSHDIVVGKRRNYVVETIDSHYRHAHYGSDLDALRGVIAQRSPEFVPAYDVVFSGRKLSLYNMFLTRGPVFQEYSSWVFPILEATSERIGSDTSRTTYQQRTEGYLGERLLNVWLAGRPDLRIHRRRIVNVDGEPKLTKAVRLIGRRVGAIDPAERVS